MLDYILLDNIPYLRIFISTACWTVVYILLYTLIRRAEYSVRLLTLLHACSSVLLDFYICVIRGPTPLVTHNVGVHNDWWHIQGMLFSAGYFLFDLTWSLYMNTEKPIMLAHHFISIFGFLLCFNVNVSGAEILACTGGAELSNPFLQWRWFLIDRNKYDSNIGRFVDHMFILVWFLIRMGLGTWLYFVVILSNNVIIAIKIGSTAMFCVSIGFTYGIIGFYRKKYGPLLSAPKYFLNEFPILVRTYRKLAFYKYKSLLLKDD